jgi:hypothetical protein
MGIPSGHNTTRVRSQAPASKSKGNYRMYEYEYLPDAVNGKNRSPVFIKVIGMEHTIGEALRLIRNPGSGIYQLKRRQPYDDTLTVIYEVEGCPWLHVGRTRSTPPNPKADIQRVLGEAWQLID